MRIHVWIATGMLFLLCCLPARAARAGETLACQRLEQKSLGTQVDWCRLGGENVFLVNGSWQDAAAQGIRYSMQARNAGRIIEHLERMDILAAV